MHVPSSTYRVQLHREFAFEELKGIVDYIHELGVSAIYAAPIGSATPGSMHGYDVTDPNRINPEVGNRRDMQELYHMLKAKEMIWLQDIVPNHMAFSKHNLRLMDVLERGERSPYYNYFDIDWNHPDPLLTGKIMAPFLGKEPAQCLEEKEIRLSWSGAGLTLDYYDDQYPVSWETFELLIQRSEREQSELHSFLRKLQQGMSGDLSLDEWSAEKQQWISVIDAHDCRGELIQLLDSLNDDVPGLTRVLELQHYRLAYWKTTESKINYRRFFTINSLICLRMGNDQVFEEYHRMIHKLYQSGFIQGVRIDHIDGLNDPAAYLNKLRNLLGEDCYIIAEKILEGEEDLPGDWPIQGTSGYEFLSNLNKLLTDPKGSEKLVSFYRRLIPDIPPYEELVQNNKRLILEKHMAGELDNLVSYFRELGLLLHFKADRIRKALALFMFSLPVYRIYPVKLPLSGWESALIEEAFEKAIGADPGFEEELQYLRWLCIAPISEPEVNDNFLNFLKRLMQFTGPLTAKGVEDTTFYIYNPLISHDEVGDDPSTLGTSIRDFHKKMIKRSQTFPLSLNATATHDTKRGEDARVRLNLLSEIPELWMENVSSWMKTNSVHKRIIHDQEAPAKNDEYFIYQSIVGGFPEDLTAHESWKQRLKDYLIKVVREAKVISNWESPDLGYENACCDFIEDILADHSDFLQSFLPFIKEVVSLACINSIVQSVIKITAPGIPDIYQGCELWDLSYVDPDNRRPVDYQLRMRLLNELKDAYEKGFGSVTEVLDRHKEIGIMKLFAIWRSLNFRKENPQLFNTGTYLPLTQLGEANRAMGYARYHVEKWCVIILPFLLSRKNALDSIELNRNFISLPANAPKRWRNIFTEKIIEVTADGFSTHELLTDFPVAVLSNV